LTGSRKCCESCEKVSGKIKKSTPVVKKNNLARENVVKVSERVVDFFKTRVPIFKKPMPGGGPKSVSWSGFPKSQKKTPFLKSVKSVKFVKFVKSVKICQKVRKCEIREIRENL
jgi:molybdopterin synthase catalytic subunit